MTHFATYRLRRLDVFPIFSLMAFGCCCRFAERRQDFSVIALSSTRFFFRCGSCRRLPRPLGPRLGRKFFVVQVNCHMRPTRHHRHCHCPQLHLQRPPLRLPPVPPAPRRVQGPSTSLTGRWWERSCQEGHKVLPQEQGRVASSLLSTPPSDVLSASQCPSHAPQDHAEPELQVNKRLGILLLPKRHHACWSAWRGRDDGLHFLSLLPPIQSFCRRRYRATKTWSTLLGRQRLQQPSHATWTHHQAKGRRPLAPGMAAGRFMW